MGSAGWKAIIKRSGTSTQFTDEAASLVSGTTYQIDDDAKQVWDRDQPITVKDDGNAVNPDDIEHIDHLFGKVTFVNGYTPAGAIEISGNYLPMQAVAGAHTYSLNHSGDVLDETSFDSAQNNGGYRSRKLGLRDVSVSITRWDDLSHHFVDVITNRDVVVVEIRPGGDSEVFRAFMVAESANASGDVSALESEEISFQLDGDGIGKAFSWDS